MTTGTRYPCPDCGSSDGVMIDPEDNHTYCFACKKRRKSYGGDTDSNYTRNSRSMAMVADIDDIRSYPCRSLDSRRISKEVCEFFGVKAHQWDNKPAHFYPYGDDACKVRILPKEFRMIGKATKLFGQREFPTGSKMIVITEGELDALSVAQASHATSQKIWPVVSLPSAGQTSILLEQRDWLKQFKEVVLWFDSDDAGQKAVQSAAKIIGFNRVKVVQTNGKGKDASDILMTQGVAAVNQMIWSAQAYSPAGIVGGNQMVKAMAERQETESIPYPDCLSGLNKKLKGVRYGEITLFTSGTGSGKSTVIKEIILDLLNKTDDKIGLISLEESVGDTTEKLVCMARKKVLDDGERLSESEIETILRACGAFDRLVLLDHQGSVADTSLIDQIEYMCLMGCKYLVLDHITIAVSEGAEGLEGNAAIDKVMSDLLKVVKKHNVWLGLISHLRKSGGKAFEEGNMASIDDVKGSGSIKQISFDIIAFSRNLTAESESERNLVRFSVLKSRFTGLTGPAGSAVYNRTTGRLSNNDTGFSV